MFEDLDQDATPRDSRGRMGASVAISAVIFLLIGGGLAAAVATAHAVVAERERDIPVEFASLEELMAEVPEPEVPEPTVQETRAPVKRARARRRSLRPPTEIPEGRPQEAEGELGEAGETGPLDGFVGEEGEGGTLGAESQEESEVQQPPPARERRQVRETISPPRFVSGCRAPQAPEDALYHQAATIRVEVRVMVGVDGRVQNARVAQHHPLIPDDLILRCARDKVFEPARLPDGTAVPYPRRFRFTFRPNNA